MTTGYAARRFQIWLETDDGTVLDLSRFQADFPINAIPSATVEIALGRRADDVSTASAVHRLADRFRIKQSVKVYFQGTALGQDVPAGVTVSPDLLFDGNKHLLFDGYTSGPGYQRSPTAASYTLGIEHWLVDLTLTSAVSAQSHPANPADLVFPTMPAVVSPELNQGRAALGGLSGTTLASNFLGTDVPSNLWGLGIWKWYRALAGTDHLADAVAGQFGRLFGNAGPNRQALAALDRMSPSSPYQPGLKLRLDGGSAARQAIVRNIQQEISLTTIQSMAGTTLWDNLMALSSSYLFAVVPRINDALVVPWMPTLRTVYKTIYASEVDPQAFSGDTPRLLRGVALITGKNADAGASLGEPAALRQVGMGGVYLARPDGMVLLVQAPTWLSNVCPDLFVNLGPLPQDYVRPAAAAPQGGKAPAVPQPADALKGMRSPLDLFARSVYGLEVLRFRAGMLEGKLRFDIAPGSILKIEVAGERFLSQLRADQFGQPVYAAVRQVSLLADAEAGRCGTALALAHVRFGEENSQDATSLAEHPLYENTWSGATLFPT